MNNNPAKLSAKARQAAQRRDWATVKTCATQILKRDRNSAEGHFLAGLAEKSAGRLARAAESFSMAIALDARRYDAAIELANQYVSTNRYGEAAALLRKFESQLGNSPRYLDMGGTIYTNIGLPEKGWPLYQKAIQLQPDIPQFQANLAACSVFVDKIDEAKATYKALLQQYPTHQRNHYQLSRLEKARDTTHIEQMKKVLRSTNLPAEKNIFLYYAIGKELEDLGQWDEAFHHFKLAGDAAAGVASYDVKTDLSLIDKIIEVCDTDWLNATSHERPSDASGKIPIFIVGLPRTGTTLTERIVSSHSKVESIGETYFLRIALRRESGIESVDDINPDIIEAVANADMNRVGDVYLNAVRYKFGDKPYFVEKFPENFLYLGFIARAFPDARIVHLKRNPMDACFALYKQSFFRFAYTLDDLGRYYVAYDRLMDHWRETLKDRLIEVEYESLVEDQEGETRRLLGELGLQFEEACLDFHKNVAASATASSVQVREKIHTRSVKRWRQFEKHLQSLREHLENAGIAVE